MWCVPIKPSLSMLIVVLFLIRYKNNSYSRTYIYIPLHIQQQRLKSILGQQNSVGWEYMPSTFNDRSPDRFDAVSTSTQIAAPPSGHWPVAVAAGCLPIRGGGGNEQSKFRALAMVIYKLSIRYTCQHIFLLERD